MGNINKSAVNDWLTDDGLMLIESWARDGQTRIQIAENIGIAPNRLSEWARTYEEIDKALKTGREVVDYRVENALLKSALGFKTKEIKVTIGRQVVNGVPVDLIKETTVKEVAPSVTACLAWLNNRRPDKWKRNRDKVIELDEEENDLQITIVRGAKSEENKELDNVNKEVIFNKKAEAENKKEITDVEEIEEINNLEELKNKENELKTNKNKTKNSDIKETKNKNKKTLEKENKIKSNKIELNKTANRATQTKIDKKADKKTDKDYWPEDWSDED
jgi:DNA polymerase III alpha subunit